MSADLFAVPSVFLDRLTALGLDVARLIAHAKLSPAQFREPTIRLATADFMALWRAIEHFGGPDIGLRIASNAQPHQHDVASMAALHSPTFGDALLKKARYKRITCPQELGLEVRGGEVRVRFVWLEAKGELPHSLIDVTFASLLALVRHGTGTLLTPKRLELVRTRPMPAYFGCEIRYGAPADVMVFPESALALPFVTHNADLVAIMTVGLDAALAERASSTSSSLDDDVRLALRRHMTGDRPSVDKIARELGVSPRTLQRRLGELGTTYQTLLDEIRLAAARDLLATTSLDASEIAFLLGYEELNSFARAFHSWEGVSPLQWRSASGGT